MLLTHGAFRRGVWVREGGEHQQWQEKAKLHSLLLEHHQAFALEDGECGEIGLVQMTLDTPKKQPVCRIPFAGH